jgi:hypothetical protein
VGGVERDDLDLGAAQVDAQAKGTRFQVGILRRRAAGFRDPASFSPWPFFRRMATGGTRQESGL